MHWSFCGTAFVLPTSTAAAESTNSNLDFMSACSWQAPNTGVQCTESDLALMLECVSESSAVWTPRWAEQRLHQSLAPGRRRDGGQRSTWLLRRCHDSKGSTTARWVADEFPRSWVQAHGKASGC